MRLKEKLYRRFCAPEVRMLLGHMEEKFEDFVDDYQGRKMWVRLLEAKDYSKIERKTIKMVYERLRREHARQELLGKIIAQKLNPEVAKNSDDFMDANRYATAINQHRQAVAAHQNYVNQYAGQQYANQLGQQYQQDPRAIFGRTP
jgi:hypothetical protein